MINEEELTEEQQMEAWEKLKFDVMFYFQRARIRNKNNLGWSIFLAVWHVAGCLMKRPAAATPQKAGAWYFQN